MRREDQLTASQLGAQELQRPPDLVRTQIREQCGEVGQPGERCEGGTALEVDEDELQPARWALRGEADHDRAQHLGLPASRGTGNQQVRVLVTQLDALDPGSGHAERSTQHVHRARRWQRAPRPRARRVRGDRVVRLVRARGMRRRSTVRALAVRAGTVRHRALRRREGGVVGREIQEVVGSEAAGHLAASGSDPRARRTTPGGHRASGLLAAHRVREEVDAEPLVLPGQPRHGVAPACGEAQQRT